MSKQFMYASKKENFLKTVKEKEKHLYEWIFEKTYRYEQKNGKDLYDFKLDEVKDFLRSIKINKSTLEITLYRIRKYMEWAKENNYKFISKIPLDKDTQKQIVEELGKQDKEAIHFDKIRNFLGDPTLEDKVSLELKNIQDKLLVQLLFIGVRGKGLCELINLSYDDIDGNTITLRGEDYTRKIKVTDSVVKLIEKSKQEQSYYRYLEAESDTRLNDVEIYELPYTGYVFRKVTVGANGKDKRISTHTLNKRLETIGEYVGEKITSMRLEYSGMVFFAKVLHDQYNYTVNKETVEKIILPQFNKSKVKYQQILKYVKQIKQSLKDIYDLDVDEVKKS